METEIRYRFCVRAKPAPDVPEVSRRIFITRYHITEDEARARYEVVECLLHTAMVVSFDGYSLEAQHPS